MHEESVIHDEASSHDPILIGRQSLRTKRPLQILEEYGHHSGNSGRRVKMKVHKNLMVAYCR